MEFSRLVLNQNWELFLRLGWTWAQCTGSPCKRGNYSVLMINLSVKGRRMFQMNPNFQNTLIKNQKLPKSSLIFRWKRKQLKQHFLPKHPIERKRRNILSASDLLMRNWPSILLGLDVHDLVTCSHPVSCGHTMLMQPPSSTNEWSYCRGQGFHATQQCQGMKVKSNDNNLLSDNKDFFSRGRSAVTPILCDSDLIG